MLKPIAQRGDALGTVALALALERRRDLCAVAVTETPNTVQKLMFEPSDKDARFRDYAESSSGRLYKLQTRLLSPAPVLAAVVAPVD
jgi:hypothetical protein